MKIGVTCGSKCSQTSKKCDLEIQFELTDMATCCQRETRASLAKTIIWLAKCQFDFVYFRVVFLIKSFSHKKTTQTSAFRQTSDY